MIGGLLKSTSSAALFAAVGLFALGAGVPAATAADLGGDCCADLEERVAELEATTARKGNRRVSLTITGQVSTALMAWDDGNNERGSDVYVVENVMARFAADAYPVLLPDLQREVEEAGTKRLHGILEDADFRELKAVPVVRTSAAPAAAIVDYANEAGVDLIILGTHGRGAMAKLFMGSVAERVVRMASCPVLTVRHPEHEFIVPDALVTVEKD